MDALKVPFRGRLKTHTRPKGPGIDWGDPHYIYIAGKFANFFFIQLSAGEPADDSSVVKDAVAGFPALLINNLLTVCSVGKHPAE